MAGRARRALQGRTRARMGVRRAHNCPANSDAGSTNFSSCNCTAGFSMHPVNLSRLCLFQRHLRSLVWVWVWVWDWIHWHSSPHTRSPSSLHPPFTHYSFSPRSLVCGGQTSPHKPRLVVSHSTCSPRSSSPHAHSFVLGTAVIVCR